MKVINRSLLATILSVSIVLPALSSSSPQEEQGEGVIGTGRTTVETSELLKIFPTLPLDIRRYLQTYHIDNIKDLHKKDDAMYRLGLVNQGNWLHYEKIAFNPVDIHNFAEQAVAPEFKNKFSEKDVIEYFGLDTTVGRMKFRKMMDKGMPELLASGELMGAFNAAYFGARDKILQASPNTTSMNLERSQLKLLPREIGQLTNLTKLYLAYNQLTWVPAELGKLTNLKTLELHYNQLTWVPAELGKLTNLTKLDLEDNQLISVPAELGMLTNLTKLYLAYNKLTWVPAELGKLTNLTKLALSLNKLTSVPAELGKLTNLTDLYLRSNPLKTLPISLSPASKPGLKITGFNGNFAAPD